MSELKANHWLRVAAAVAVSVLLLSCKSAPPPGPVPPVERKGLAVLDVRTGEFPKVDVFLRATDASAAGRVSLSPSAWRVRESGSSAPVLNVRRASRADIPRSIAFVVDNSSSEARDRIRQVAARFAGGLEGYDQVTAVAMGPDNRAITPLKWNQPARLGPALADLPVAPGDRELARAMRSALERIEALPERARHNAAVVVFAARPYRGTKGDTGSLIPALKRSPVPIHVVGVPQGRGSISYHEKGLLTRLAKATGGLRFGAWSGNGHRDAVLQSFGAPVAVTYRSQRLRPGDVELEIRTSGRAVATEYRLGEQVSLHVAEQVQGPLARARSKLAEAVERAESALESAREHRTAALEAMGAAEGTTAVARLEKAREAARSAVRASAAASDHELDDTVAASVKALRKSTVEAGPVRQVRSLADEVDRLRSRADSAGRRARRLRERVSEKSDLARYAAAVAALDRPNRFNTDDHWQSFREYLASGLEHKQLGRLFEAAFQARSLREEELIAADRAAEAAELWSDFLGAFAAATPEGAAIPRGKVLCRRAQARRLAGRLEQAARDYRKAVDLEGGGDCVGRYLRALVDLDRTSEVAEAAEEHLDAPARKELFRSIVRDRAQSDTPDAVVQLIESLVSAGALETADVPARVAGRAYARSGEAERAIAYFDRLDADELDRADRVAFAEALLAKGGDRAAGRVVDLLKQYQDWAEELPSSPSKQKVLRTLYAFGRGLHEQGKRNAAAFVFNAIQEYDPDFEVDSAYTR